MLLFFIFIAMKILIINGPNLNLLGRRQPEIYGHVSFEAYLEEMRAQFTDVELDYFQSNSEGEIVSAIQKTCYPERCCDGIVINPGAYAHYSYAIADALSSVEIPAVEVHISNIHAREEFRHRSVTASSCRGVIAGLGLAGYFLAVESLWTQK